MGSMSNYLQNKIIDHLYRSATFAKPGTIYYAVFTAAPTAAGGGTEVSGGSYARVALAPLDANFNATQGGTSGASSGTSGLTSNAVSVTFPAPSANWGVLTAWASFDAPTGGNQLTQGLLTNNKTVNNGDAAPTFPPGSFQMNAS